jgi:hypothetical protein
MQIPKNKIAASVIALFLMSVMATSLVASPARAQTGTSRKTYPFIDTDHNPVGMGQQVLIRFGILQQTGLVTWGWTGLTVTVTAPNGKTETLGPFETDSTGGTYTLYTPSQTGTYTLKVNFPEQTVPVDYFSYEAGEMIFAGTTMLASTSTMSLVVQQQPIPSYPTMPLPSSYWSRPIDAQLREWYSIAGNWVTRPPNSLADDNAAPETAHVLWAKQLTTGGLTGDIWGVAAGHTHGAGPVASETGDAYEGKFINPVIMNGILYYNEAGTPPGIPESGIYAVDLHTGQLLWYKNATQLSFGQILYFNSWNFDGVYTYIWDTSGGTTWNAYDPFNGDWIYTMTNVPSGSEFRGPSGEILIPVYNYTAGWMALWNSTAAGQANPQYWNVSGAMEGNYGSWGSYMRPLVQGSTFDAQLPGAFSWNVTIPLGLTAGSNFFAPIIQLYPDDRIMSVDFNRTMVRIWALNVKGLNNNSKSASLLFDKYWNAPAEWLAGMNTIQIGGWTNNVTKGVVSLWDKELRKHYGFSVETGNYMWETDSEHFLDAYGWGNVEHTWYYAYGKLYSVGVGGIVYAYDDQTGKTLWTYNMTDPYNEAVTGNYWWGWIMLISNGKVYVGTLEHSAEQPLPRGGPFVCLNATTGAEIFRVNGMFRETRWGNNGIIGDSIIATMDTYDQRVYAIGKGPSATTVTAPGIGVVAGNSVVISGTVTDISPGTEDYALTARFPNGVAAVSDASMNDWMLYVYKQFPYPTNCTGVEVTLDALDPNNNFIHIGTATSDTSGAFGYAWKTPDVPGKYTIVATFAGSKAYYASYAETFAVVQEVPAATPPPQYPVPPDFTWTIIGMGIAIIIAVVIVGILLLLRKK